MCSAASRKLCHFNHCGTLLLFLSHSNVRTHIELGHTPKTHIQYGEIRFCSFSSLFHFQFFCFILLEFLSFYECVTVAFCRLKLSFHSMYHYPQLVFKADAAGAAINDQIVQIRFVKLPLNVNISDAERDKNNKSN